MNQENRPFDWMLDIVAPGLGIYLSFIIWLIVMKTQ